MTWGCTLHWSWILGHIACGFSRTPPTWLAQHSHCVGNVNAHPQHCHISSVLTRSLLVMLPCPRDPGHCSYRSNIGSSDQLKAHWPYSKLSWVKWASQVPTCVALGKIIPWGSHLPYYDPKFLLNTNQKTTGKLVSFSPLDSWSYVNLWLHIKIFWNCSMLSK